MGRKDSVRKQKSHVLLPGWIKQQDLFQYPAIQTGWESNLQARAQQSTSFIAGR